MTNQQQALQSISDTFGGPASMDQILGMVAFSALIAVYIVYGIFHYISHGKRST